MFCMTLGKTADLWSSKKYCKILDLKQRNEQQKENKKVLPWYTCDSFPNHALFTSVDNFEQQHTLGKRHWP